MPWAIRVLVRPRVVLEVRDGAVSVEGRELLGELHARVSPDRLGPRGTQEYGPVEIFQDGVLLIRLDSTHPHRAADVVSMVEGLPRSSRDA